MLGTGQRHEHHVAWPLSAMRTGAGTGAPKQLAQHNEAMAEVAAAAEEASGEARQEATEAEVLLHPPGSGSGGVRAVTLARGNPAQPFFRVLFFGPSDKGGRTG